jgi:hypothetical protein
MSTEKAREIADSIVDWTMGDHPAPTLRADIASTIAAALKAAHEAGRRSGIDFAITAAWNRRPPPTPAPAERERNLRLAQRMEESAKVYEDEGSTDTTEGGRASWQADADDWRYIAAILRALPASGAGREPLRDGREHLADAAPPPPGEPT